jgi:hypothetical protein
MPKKADRPITAIVFPKSGQHRLLLSRLPVDKEPLEGAIAQRFAVALSAEGEPCQWLGRGIEPGDALLRGNSGRQIHLQLVEAVDLHRIRITSLRRAYGAAIWNHEPKLVCLLRGVSVSFDDFGSARDLPKLDSVPGRAIVADLSRQLMTLDELVRLLPENANGGAKGFKTWLSSPFRIEIRLVRHAPIDTSVPPRWIWTGSHPVRDGDELSRFFSAMEPKLAKYSRIADPFWLVAYTIDCGLDPAECARIRQLVGRQAHPFDRVFLFFPYSEMGTIVKVFPETTLHPLEQTMPLGKLRARFRPEDMVPKLDDPRWIVVESSCS